MSIKRSILFFIIIVVLVVRISYLSSKSNSNTYILYTKNGEIKCNYHNSRDLYMDGFEYIDFYTKENNWIDLEEADSILVIDENWWTCGPRNKKLKYIE